jgi:hypothetical protein
MQAGSGSLAGAREREPRFPDHWRGKRVAIVGNAADILERSHGAEIDAHELVVRMNAGAPSGDQAEALGLRTDVLSVGHIRALRTSLATLAKRGIGRPDVLWAKNHTPYGRRQRKGCAEAEPCYDYPALWFCNIQDRVGAAPSQGATLMALFPEKLDSSSVDLYGFSFFGAAGSPDSWWHTAYEAAHVGGKHPHDGAKELAFCEGLGYERDGDVWRWKRQG